MQDNGSDEKGWLLNTAIASSASRDQQSRFLEADILWNAPRPFDPGIWYFVVGTYDGTEQRLYVDGALVATAREQQGDIVMPEDTAFVRKPLATRMNFIVDNNWSKSAFGIAPDGSRRFSRNFRRENSISRY
ncbi:MAG: LamG-like jellyroll fold domain-containing protein [Planctomycetaceae bacterium]